MPEETKESLEDRAKLGFKEDYNSADCKKKKFSKDYYLCKEPEKAPLCSHAIQIVSGKYCCPKGGKVK